MRGCLVISRIFAPFYKGCSQKFIVAIRPKYTPNTWNCSKYDGTSRWLQQRRCSARDAATSAVRSIISNPSLNLSDQEGPTKGSGHGTFGVDFSNTQNAFKTKTILEILRALVVLKVCSYNYVVDNSMKLMKTSQRVLGRRLTARLLKSTFYGQFVAGDDAPTIMRCVERLKVAGIAPLLAIPLEDDIGQYTERDKDTHCAENMKVMERCVDQSVEVCERVKPILMQVRLSPLVEPQLLIKVGELIKDGGYNYDDGGPISIQNFAKGLNQTNQKIERIPELTDDEFEHLNNSLHRLDRLAQHATSHNTKILVDAEYTYLNPAMTLLTLALMYKYNKIQPFIWNTYQTYLKAAHTNITRDIIIADKLGFTFGVKLVRGAYIDREKARAEQMGYEDPINPDYETTNKTYNENMVMLLNLIKEYGSKYNIIVASHNEDSLTLAVNMMNKLDIGRLDGTVCFGQVLGMCDQATFALGQSGYLVYKSIPIGAIDDVMPYLARRAAENRSVLARAGRERQLLWAEFKRRMKKS